MHTIKIDTREKDLIKLLPAFIKEDTFMTNKIHIVVCPLDIGDFILENSSGEEIIIFERKSVQDLASSIQDGRYNEQSMRLNATPLHNHNIQYIIEGSIDTYRNKYSRITKEAIYSAMFSLNYYKGFSVMRSENVAETGTYIVKVIKKILRDTQKPPFYTNMVENMVDTNTGMNTGMNANANTIVNANTIKSINEMEHINAPIPDYTSVIKRVKKDNITPENIGSVILSQIPGISNVISKVILDKYGSLYELMITLHNEPNILNNETYVTQKGQTRRISHKCIQSIKDFLLYKKQNIISIET